MTRRPRLPQRLEKTMEEGQAAGESWCVVPEARGAPGVRIDSALN